VAATKPRSAGARHEWSRRVERSALELHPGLLAEARANSRKLADLAFLLGLAREIALARGPELTLAYRNVVMVQPGFKKERQGDRDQLTRERPCSAPQVDAGRDRSGE
jgi:hypothetical protein